MKLYLHPNTLSDERIQAAIRCARMLDGRFECFTSAENAAWLNPGRCKAASPEDCDAIAAFGGDGTMLRAAHLALAANKPLMGINTGRLGYLCALREGDLADFDEAAFHALRPSPRTLLEFEWDGETRLALNELTLIKRDYGTTLDTHALLNGKPLGSWQGDGLIVATPTGSSAYNLSAGGPHLTPSSGCFVLTPMCPTGLNRASIVFSDSDTLTLSAAPRFSPQDACVYADGVCLGILSGELVVRRSKQALVLLEKPDAKRDLSTESRTSEN